MKNSFLFTLMLAVVSFTQSSILISAINDKASIAYSIALIAIKAHTSESAAKSAQYTCFSELSEKYCGPAERQNTKIT